MYLPYAYSYPDIAPRRGNNNELFAQYREAALRILQRFGRDVHLDAAGTTACRKVRLAWRDGFTIRYICCDPGAHPRTERTTWRTPQGSLWDPHQHVIEIEIDARVLSIGWRGDGPIGQGCYDWGPWEFELLRAASMPADDQPDTGRMLAFPFHGCPWSAKGKMDFAMYERKLITPLTIAVIGYSQCVLRHVQPGTTHSTLREMLMDDYRSSRKADGMLRREKGRTTCFEVHGWKGRKIPRSGRPKARPDFSYWVGPGSIPLAADLLLLFDREMHNEKFGLKRQAA